MSKQEDTKIKYSMFRPKSKRGLLADYPELKDYFDTGGLNRSEMLFVWYYGCRVSPLFDLEDDRTKIEQCLDASFGYKITNEDREKWMSGGIPHKILEAIESMQKFQPGPRVRAMLMTERMLNNIEEIININL